jgi:hypothetical protein
MQREIIPGKYSNIGTQNIRNQESQDRYVEGFQDIEGI